MKLQQLATPKWSNLEVIARIYAEAERLTVETGVKHEVHHIHPVMEFKELFVGLHVPWNLEILTSEEHAEAHIELKRQFGDALAQAKK
jgi:5-methylcytosine-specific restriction endonuclease McrA